MTIGHPIRHRRRKPKVDDRGYIISRASRRIEREETYEDYARRLWDHIRDYDGGDTDV